jgi:hypothetical protein
MSKSLWLARRPVVLAGAVAAVVALTAAVSAVSHGHSRGHNASSRPVSVQAGPVTAVDLQAVPGHLSVVSTTSGRATLTGVLDWTGHAPTARTRVAGHRLSLAYRCAPKSPCTANWRLVVPQRAAVELRVPAGYVDVTGLAGPLQITASSVDVSATGLRSPRLDAAITSGHLGATFRTPPRQVSIGVTAAQATLMLPASVPYSLSDQVTSGYIQVGIPQAANSQRTVTATVVSGDIALLPA